MVLRTALTPPSLGAIADEFSLGPVSARYIDAGARNTSYLLAGEHNRYVATVLESKNCSSAQAYGSLLDQVASCGLPTPPPLKTRQGLWAHVVEGKPVIVTPFVEGTSTGSLSDAELFGLGALLASVHRSGVPCDAPPSLRIGSSDISWLRAKDDPFARWALEQHERIGEVANEGDLCTLTHGDPFRDNVLVTATGALVLIDWEDAALDRPVVDLAQAALSHCDDHGLDLGRVECLLTGYHADRPIQQISLTQTLRMATYAGLVIAYMRYRRHLAGFSAADPYLAMWKLANSLSRRFR